MTIPALFARAVIVLLAAIQPQQVQFNTTVEYVPAAIPTSLTCLVGPASTCQSVTQNTTYVCEADFAATGQTITVQDGQPSPIVWISNTLGANGSTSTWIWTATNDSTCRIFPGGVYVQAGGAGVTGHLTIKYLNR